MTSLLYQISFQGTASDTLRAAFDDCQVETAPGVTVLRCRHELLNEVLDRLGSYGLELIDVRLVAQ